VDDLKHGYRDVKTEVKKTARGIDGTDTKDRIGNAGNELDKDLGNLGDDIRKAGRTPEVPGDRPAASGGPGLPQGNSSLAPTQVKYVPSV
jgi:hypothetical protein